MNATKPTVESCGQDKAGNNRSVLWQKHSTDMPEAAVLMEVYKDSEMVVLSQDGNSVNLNDGTVHALSKLLKEMRQ